MASTVTDPSTEATEQRLVLSGIPWSQYEAVLAAFPEQAGLRITYLDGRLTLVSPTRRHDWYENALGRLIEAIAEGLELVWDCAGHATFRSETHSGGVEADTSYYFGEHARLVRGPVDVDLASQPPPDLVAEVELTHGADEAVAAWCRLGVPEIWRLDLRRWTLTFLARSDLGEYVHSPTSRAFPAVRSDEVLELLRRGEDRTLSEWRRDVEKWVRDTVVPRHGA